MVAMTEYDYIFLTLVSEIAQGLLNNKHAYSIDQILKRYSELLFQYDITTMKKQIYVQNTLAVECLYR